MLQIDHGLSEVLDAGVDRQRLCPCPPIQRLYRVRFEFQRLVARGLRGLIVLSFDVARGYIEVECVLEPLEFLPLALGPSMVLELPDLVVVDALLLPLRVARHVVPEDAQRLYRNYDGVFTSSNLRQARS